ncbi:MAG: histidine kinase [Anaerolineae bacterium]|nr:histidine kinase [Anaerolineae bacterium]
MNSEAKWSDLSFLRQQAELLLSGEQVGLDSFSPVDALQLIHELRVYQIELEMQNEELRNAQYALEKARNKYADLYDFAPEGYLSIDEEGIIREANLTVTNLLAVERQTLIGQPLSHYIYREDQDGYYLHRHELFATGQPQTCELRLTRADGSHFCAQLKGVGVENHQGQVHQCRIAVSDITQTKQAEQEKDRLLEKVSRQREELRALTIQLTETEEAERKQLARELHDQVGPNLTALGLNLNIIQGQIPDSLPAADAIQTRLSDSQLLLEQITERIRDVMTDLRPPVLDDYGLVAALRWYSTRFAARMNLSVTIQGDEPLPRLATSVETALFRIAQEALTNSAKHAQASQVTLKVETEAGLVRLTIADDGRGFEPCCPLKPAKQQGWGLLTMTERAEALGGKCLIISQPGHGAQVIVEIPR